MKLKECLEKYYGELVFEINHMTYWHWVRLGICFGLLRWFDFSARMIIAGRGIERVMTVYQMGVMDRTENTILLGTVGDIYANGFIFECIFIILVVYGIWFLLLWKFGIPKKTINL